MSFKSEKLILILIIVSFLFLYFLPVGNPRFDNAVFEAMALAKWYAREHVILCLIPAFFIAGAISVFLSQDSVMRYLGPDAPKLTSYGVASVSGTILAVCSCTVLPLFAGIYTMGAGLGPATAFLYSGPAINILAIVLTAKVLGMKIGIARAIGAILFSLVVGGLMAFIFRDSEEKRQAAHVKNVNSDGGRPLLHNASLLFAMVGILVFANWGKADDTSSVFHFLYVWKWVITSVFAVILGVILTVWFGIKAWKLLLTGVLTVIAWLLFPDQYAWIFVVATVGVTISAMTTEGEMKEWINSTWTFAKQILPLLLIGVLIAGFAFGRPGHEGIIPSTWVSSLVGGNSLTANLFSSVVGAFMYFATLTEVPILQGLLGSGMGNGPALALLLAGPALSLPNMLVIRSVLGTKKTIVFVAIVVVMATISGILFGMFV
ncbi:conserved hypothetical protein [Thermotomaculum hydrothermale]|uniref:Permease n=1 Tax=Thermotomaculum hydrothermale TaxID=981385 RepID=A0A7R6SZT1_9BACT|nr:permease [Thermotomaculum hydrothermale]BBB33047.1 conserved hypothetical protein [Thermotomaculum hydrothermale]